jgi:cyclophilin family peptidyl-prolyl cis-trans isomerase
MLFLFWGCMHANRYSNVELQEVYSSQDERNVPILLEFLKSKEDEIRNQAAIGLGFSDNKEILPALFEVLRNDKSCSVRASAAKALGQQKDSTLGKILLEVLANEKESETIKEIIIALGKCNQYKWFYSNIERLNSSERSFYAEGLYYLIYNYGWKETYLSLCFKLMENAENETLFFTTFSLARASIIPFNKYHYLLDLNKKTEDIDIKINLIKCIVKSSKDFSVLIKLYSAEKNYLIRLNLLKSCLNLADNKGNAILNIALKDTNGHIQETVAEWSSNHIEFFTTKQLQQLIKNCKHDKAKYYYSKTLLLSLNEKEAEIFSSKLKQACNEQKDEYIKGYIFNALSAFWKNLEFIEQITFDTESILIREFGYEALLNIRKDKRFLIFSDLWNKQVSAGLTLENYYSRIIKDAIQTGDVSLIALSAEILRDSNLLSVKNTKNKIQFSDDVFLEKALKQLTLPRDIEIYGELFKTIQLRKGKKVEGQLIPDFNNPIDWDLVSRIPENQKIEIRTSKGNIKLQLWTNEAPGTVGRFLKLITDGFYENKRLHRVVPGFVIQDGCPRGDGFGSTMETIRTEIGNKAFNKAGIIGMASAGTDTESCQWFITHCATPHLNGRYTAFGEVIEGMDIVHRLMHADDIFSIKIMDN